MPNPFTSPLPLWECSRAWTCANVFVGNPGSNRDGRLGGLPLMDTTYHSRLAPRGGGGRHRPTSKPS